MPIAPAGAEIHSGEVARGRAEGSTGHEQSARGQEDAPAIDTTRLDRWRKVGGDKLVADLMASFLENVPGRIEAARAGMTALDASAVERAVHSLKSSCGNVGATAMQDLCQRAETLAAAQQMDGIPSLLSALEREFLAVKVKLESLRHAAAEGRA